MKVAFKLFQAFFILVAVLYPITALATGITADVGITPPEDRWIFRSQIRYQKRESDSDTLDRTMEMNMVPLVLAYGLRPELTAIIRQPFFHREIKMMGIQSKDSGAGDLAIIGKYRLMRLNRPDFIIGIAPTLGIEFPTGDDDFGSETLDVLSGLFFSGRKGAWGFDLNLEYKINGVDERSADRPGDEFSTVAAFAYQFSLNSQATVSLWPVLEVSAVHTRPDLFGNQKKPNTGQDIVFLSPGLKLAWQSFMVEILLQVPIDQDQIGNQLKRKTGGLVGLRYLF